MRTVSIIAFIFFVAQLSAQCGDPNTDIWKNTWASCEVTQSPNPNRGAGHWIQYEFDAVYTLTKVHIWNTNEEGKTGDGFRNVVVDYSEDGIEWTELGTFEFPQGTGEAIYGGIEAFDFENKLAKYVLLTATSNWGGDCYGLAEVKFNLRSELSCDDPPCNSTAGCAPPSGIELSEIQDTEALLAWEAVDGAEGYLVIIIIGEDEEEFEVEDPEFLLTELAPNTFYEIEILTICEDDESDIEAFSFTTASTAVDNPGQISQLSLFPNPSTSKVHVLFNSKISGSGNIQIQSSQGAHLHDQAIAIREGANNFELPLKGLTAGLYFIKLSHSDQQEGISRRLVVIR